MKTNKHKSTTQHNTEKQKDEQHGPHQNPCAREEKTVSDW
jgi:hypothetical protein